MANLTASLLLLKEGLSHRKIYLLNIIMKFTEENMLSRSKLWVSTSFNLALIKDSLNKSVALSLNSDRSMFQNHP